MEDYLQKNWWVFLLQGILLVVLGLLALSWPGLTVATVIMFIAIYLVLDGIIRTVSGLYSMAKRRTWFWTVLGGIIEILVGFMVLAYPGITTLSLLYFIGFAFLARGLFDFAVSGEAEKAGSSRGFTILVGILDVLIGAYIILNPIMGSIMILWIFGIYALIAGLVLVVKSFGLRPKKA